MNLYSELPAHPYIYGRESSDEQGEGLDLSLWLVCQGMIFLPLIICQRESETLSSG